jgi:hypothetical protein
MATQEVHLQVTRYLERLLAQNILRSMTVDAAMLEVRKWIPLANQLSDTDLRALVLSFFLSHHVYLPGKEAFLSPDSRASEIIDAVTKAIPFILDGVPVYETLTGKVTIGAKGLTAQSSGKNPSRSVSVSWTGTLSTVMTGGNFTLRKSLSKAGWSISLSYPKDTPVLDATRVGAVFGAAGDAIGGIIGATLGLTDVKDVQSVADRFSSAIGPVADAIGAIQGIKSRTKPGLHVSVAVGSPTPDKGQSGMPGGVQGFVTLTYSW